MKHTYWGRTSGFSNSAREGFTSLAFYGAWADSRINGCSETSTQTLWARSSKQLHVPEGNTRNREFGNRISPMTQLKSKKWDSVQLLILYWVPESKLHYVHCTNHNTNCTPGSTCLLSSLQIHNSHTVLVEKYKLRNLIEGTISLLYHERAKLSATKLPRQVLVHQMSN